MTERALDESASIPTGNTYDKYASTNPIEQRMMRGFFDALDDALPARASRILEVGAGEGVVTERVQARFPDADIVGLDLPDGDLLEQLRSRVPATVAGSVEALPFPDGRFDLVLAIEVLEHVHNPHAALAEIARVGRSDIVVSVPREPIWRIGNMARGRYIRQFGNTPGHINHWYSGSFRRLVDAHLDVVEVRRPLPWTMVRARCPTPEHSD